MKKIFHWLRRRQAEQDLNAELQSYLDALVEEKERAGVSTAEARRSANMESDGVDRLRERVREVWPGAWIEEALQDVRYGVRVLLHTPWFTAIAVLTLALGIGANVALFSVVDALLLRSLPFRGADRLFYISEFWPHEPSVPGAPNLDLAGWRTRGKLTDGLEAYGRGGTFTLTSGGEPEHVIATMVTAGLLDLIGAQPALGRQFTAQEDRPGGSPVVILSDQLWRRRFNSSRDVLGKSIELDGRSRTIVGVLPSSFLFPDNDFGADLLMPMQLPESPTWTEREFRLLRVIAHLPPRVTPESLRTELTGITRGTASQEPPQFITMRKDMEIRVTPLRERLSGEVRPVLLILQAAVAMVLLIACLNVANLQIARALSRRKELAVRTSLGAGRARLFRQLLTESLLLSLSGGAAGLILGAWAIGYLRAFLPANIPLIATAHINYRVLAFTMTIAVFTGVITGVAPFVRTYKSDMNEALKEGGRFTSDGSRQRLRGTLVIGEVAIAVILLTGSGLLIRSFLRLKAVDLGFDPRDVLTLRIRLSGNSYRNQDAQFAFFDRLLAHAQAMPGVRDAAIASGLPLIGSNRYSGAVVEGRPAPPPGGAPDVAVTAVSATYFRTLGLPLRRGRSFTETGGEDEDEDARPVAIVNESFASQFFPGQEAIGKHVKFGSVHSGPWHEIVGIAGNVRQEHLRSGDSPNVYIPYRQSSDQNMFLVLKSAQPGLALTLDGAKMIRGIDPSQPIDDIATMDALLTGTISSDHANMVLMSLFAALALVLAATGIFGVIAYSVSRRSHEIGLRIALGACKSDVLKLILGNGLALTLTGIALGVAGAVAAAQVLRKLLYGITTSDPLTLAAVSATFFLVALAACYLPARQAAGVDPIEVLRHD